MFKSLIDQSLKRTDYEIIVVNDGSSDKTKFANAYLKKKFY